jgi:uncharacterized protein (DUF924 family)
MTAPQDVLDYWFDKPGSPEYGAPRALWFMKSDETDAEIRRRFGPTIEAALQGRLDDWAVTAQGALALILLLDQFTRNIHRGSSAAFAGDAKALALARALVADGRDLDLAPLERWFVYLPFEHSEALADQRESMRLFGALEALSPTGALDWARKHYEVIERFGRYPHRNEILGRASTPEEIEFLRQPGSGF